jgi:transposase-like protein
MTARDSLHRGGNRSDRKARRRRFTVEYKRRIVKQADACKAAGEVGESLRREGLYSSHLTSWRAARDRGELAPGATAKKRGRLSGITSDWRLILFS